MSSVYSNKFRLCDFIPTGTFRTDSDLGSGESDLDPLDVETQRLVLEAGSGGWVALRRKQYGDRSQLWRMTGDGQLQHEGNNNETHRARDIVSITNSVQR